MTDSEILNALRDYFYVDDEMGLHWSYKEMYSIKDFDMDLNSALIDRFQFT